MKDYSKEELISELIKRVKNTPEFLAHLQDTTEGPEEFNEVLNDPISIQDEILYFMENEHGVGINEQGAVEFFDLSTFVEKIIGDLPVVVYHYTSDAILDKIKEEGLIARTDRHNLDGNSGQGVYVTTEVSGPVVDGYMNSAVGFLGGNGTCLSIKTQLADLQPDLDDEHLSCGRYQYVLPHVPPENILDFSEEQDEDMGPRA